MIDLGLLLGGMASFVGAALLVALARRHGRAHIAASGLRSPPALRVGPGQVRPRSQLPILTASELLERTGTVGALEKIRTSMGFHPDNFASDVMPLIERFAEFVQLLPASESHHHAQPGGLLIHTLDVAAYAMALRMGYKLPTGAVVEEQIRLGPVWTFGVLVAALLHDIGKPVSDVVVQVYGVDTNTPVQTWNGLAGSMNQLSAHAKGDQLSHYSVAFRENKDYGAHQRLGATLLHALVPASALYWLGSDSALMSQLLAYLEGNGDTKSSVLVEIVSKADQHSVQVNLKNGPRTRFSSAQSTPLIERLMSGLRMLLADNQLALNRPGAPLFVDPDGLHLWCVSASIADQVRKLLDEREERPKSGGGIPSDNTRLFDTWQEYGALVEPPKEFGKGSVWWVRVDIDGWSQVLTMLKFPLNLVYAQDTPRPGALRGSITPVSPSTARSAAEPQTPLESLPSPQSSFSASDPSALPQPLSSEAGDFEPKSFDDASKPGYKDEDFPEFWRPAALMHGLAHSPGDAVQGKGMVADAAPAAAQAPVPVPDPQEAEPEFLEDHDDASSRDTLKSRSPGAPVAAVQALRKTQRLPSAPFRAPSHQARPNADKFVAWLQNGLGTGELNYNESDAVLHFVPEGLAILSPKAFKLYLETNEWMGDLGESKDSMRALQLHLQKAGYLLFNKETKGYFHWYSTTKDDGTPGATLTTYVISNPQAYVRPVPAVNALLSRTTPPPKKSDIPKNSSSTV